MPSLLLFTKCIEVSLIFGRETVIVKVIETERYRLHILISGLLEDKDLIARLQASKFDLAVTETFEHGGSGLFEILGIKTMIAGASLGIIHNHYTISGLPNLISFVPCEFPPFCEFMAQILSLPTATI